MDESFTHVELWKRNRTTVMVMRSMSVKTAIVLIPSHWINAKSVEPDEQLLKPKPQYRIRRHLSSRRRQVCAEFAIISSQGGELVGDKFAFILGQADGGLVSAEPFVVPGGGDRRRYELASAKPIVVPSRVRGIDIAAGSAIITSRGGHVGGSMHVGPESTIIREAE